MIDLQRIAEALGGAKRTANGWDCRCPAHDDGNASLSVSTNDHGDLLVHCHAGCPQSDVIAALRERGLWPGKHRQPRVEQRWRTFIVDGSKSFEKVRYYDRDGNKKYRWEPPLKEHGLTPRQLAFYGAEHIKDTDREIGICEGEKAAEALRRLGVVALGTVTGASYVPDDTAIIPLLRGRQVTLWPDADEPGNDHMYRLAQRLDHFGIKWRAVQWPDAPPKGDAADFVAAGGTVDQYRAFPEIKLRKPERKPREQQRPQKAKSASVTGHELTDLGNAERFVEQHGDDCRFVPEWGWIVWDRKRWARDVGALKARKLAAKTARSIREEAAGVRDKDRFAKVAAHAARSESAAKIAAMLTLAEPKLSASVNDFDLHPMLFNCANGTIDLSTGERRPHRREDMLTQLSLFRFNSEATAPSWLHFLDEILPDAAVQSFVWKAAGYSMSGDIGEQVLLFCHGGGANGKSTFIEAIAHALGDYATTAPPGLLLASRNDGHPCELVALQGARFVSSQETAENRSLDEERVKQLTGADRITARHMHKEFFTFSPSHKLWLCSNHRPRIRGTDYAIWRRIRLIPFTVQIPEEKRDPELLDKLKAEAEGILAWAVRGALLWRQERLKAPPAVMAAVEEYRTSEDVIGQWLDERTRTGRAETTAKAIYADFRGWCEEHGERALSQRHLGLKLRERGFSKEHRKAGDVWLGIALNSVDSCTAEYDGQPRLQGVR